MKVVWRGALPEPATDDRTQRLYRQLWDDVFDSLYEQCGIGRVHRTPRPDDIWDQALTVWQYDRDLERWADDGGTA